MLCQDVIDNWTREYIIVADLISEYLHTLVNLVVP